MSAVALFRCDASPSIGAGHVMRCLAFAEVLTWAGWNCRFLVNREATTTVPALPASRFGVDVADDASAETMSAGVKAVVIDHYALDALHESKFRPLGVPIVAFDDLADRAHDCDILVDPTPGRQLDEYASLVSTRCRLLLGPLHAMVRRSWRERRDAAQRQLSARGPARRILVSMGATDPRDATSAVLAAIVATGLNSKVDVVLGAEAPNRACVESNLTPAMTLHVDPANLPDLIAGADLVIGAPGSSNFERAVLGVPALLIALADNQARVASGLEETGAAKVLSGSILAQGDALAREIAEFAGNAEKRADIARAAADLTDGRGVFRLLCAIAGEATSRQGTAVRLRLAEPEDEAWLLALQRQPGTRTFSPNPSTPSESEHGAWFAKTLRDENRLLAIVEADGEPAGMVRLDRISNAPVTFEVSIAISGHFRDRGIGATALSLLRRLAPGADLTASILEENRASLALFTAAGYRAEVDGRYRSRVA